VRRASIALSAAYLCVPTITGSSSGAAVHVRPTASRRRVHGSVCRWRVGSTCSSHAEAVVDILNCAEPAEDRCASKGSLSWWSQPPRPTAAWCQSAWVRRRAST